MDQRLKKDLTAGGRSDRANHDSVREAPEEKFVSAEQRRKMWKDEWTQSALPSVPEISGWHLCWLSTTNGYDSIDKRIRLGYVPVKAEEIPGYENYRVKAGQHDGYIACNEMLLYKLPMDVYQEVMTAMHHDAPMEDAEKIRIQAEQLQGKDSSGKRLGSVEGEGLGNLDKPVPVPVFAG